MIDRRKIVAWDLGLRLGGLALLGGCWLAARWMLAVAAARGHGQPGATDVLAAALAFLSFSAGGILVALGAHIFDEIEVSERWARQTYRLDRREADPSPPALRETALARALESA